MTGWKSMRLVSVDKKLMIALLRNHDTYFAKFQSEIDIRERSCVWETGENTLTGRR
jgi:hypothetical protein